MRMGVLVFFSSSFFFFPSQIFLYFRYTKDDGKGWMDAWTKG